jgi:hypothetical protein
LGAIRTERLNASQTPPRSIAAQPPPAYRIDPLAAAMVETRIVEAISGASFKVTDRG